MIALPLPDPPVVVGELVIVAYGRPAPQGSKKPFINPNTGRAAMKEQTASTLVPWRADVKAAAEAVIARLAGDQDWLPLDGPLAVSMVFTVARAAGHYGTGRNAGTVRASAPHRPAGTPDLSKLCRSTEDALTSAGVWRDDSRVVEYTRLAKVYAGEDPEALDRPGVRISIAVLSKVDWP